MTAPIIFDTSALKIAFVNNSLKKYILENALFAPKRLETEILAPSLVRTITAIIGEAKFALLKDTLFENIAIFPRSVTKNNEKQATELLAKFGAPLHDGDIEYISLCLAKRPCVFVTEDSGMLGEKLIKHLTKEHRITVLDCKSFIEQYCT